MIKLGDDNLGILSGSCTKEEPDKAFIEYRTKWKTWHENKFVGNFPLFIDVEVTNHCNLKCPFCIKTITNKKIKKGFMLWDVFKKIVDEGTKNGLYGIKLNIRGEPLLHSKIIDFVDYAKQKGLIDVYFNTNATFLTADISEKLVDVGLDRISVSFEGTTKEVYEKNRVGANYEKTVANILRLKQIRDLKAAENPKIRVQMVNLPGLDCDEYKRFWKDKVDEVACLKHQDKSIKTRKTASNWQCTYLWRRCSVLWDGTILFCGCNRDDYGSIESGNIKNIDIKSVWNSDKVNNVRSLHEKGQAHKISVCNKCPLRNSEIN